MRTTPMPGHYENPADNPGAIDQPARPGLPIMVAIGIGVFTYLVLLIVGVEMVHNVTRYEEQAGNNFWSSTWTWVAPLISLLVAIVSVPIGVIANRWLPNRHPGEDVQRP